jgi:hypothetical protein
MKEREMADSVVQHVREGRAERYGVLKMTTTTTDRLLADLIAHIHIPEYEKDLDGKRTAYAAERLALAEQQAEKVSAPQPAPNKEKARQEALKAYAHASHWIVRDLGAADIETIDKVLAAYEAARVFHFPAPQPKELPEEVYQAAQEVGRGLIVESDLGDPSRSVTFEEIHRARAKHIWNAAHRYTCPPQGAKEPQS